MQTRSTNKQQSETDSAIDEAKYVRAESSEIEVLIDEYIAKQKAEDRLFRAMEEADYEHDEYCKKRGPVTIQLNASSHLDITLHGSKTCRNRIEKYYTLAIRIISETLRGKERVNAISSLHKRKSEVINELTTKTDELQNDPLAIAFEDAKTAFAKAREATDKSARAIIIHICNTKAEFALKRSWFN